MKLLIAALALLSFVATSTLPETVVAQAATGQTQTAPAAPDTGGTMQKAPTHKGKKKHSTKHHKKKPAKKHHKKKSSKKKKPTNPS
jgi:hypothetical protein